jgi:branched-chain amino acid transport system ATP-binding protein
MLKVNDLCASYGHIVALKHVSIEADKGQIVSIIGSNGAGKTTMLRCISSLVKPTQGTIEFLDEPVPKKPHHVVKKGIVHVPEGRRTFSGLTVKDNLLVGAHLFNSKETRENLEHCFELFPILKEREDQFAGTFSGGEQQMLAIARGMMSRPKMLLLDEPSLGLAPIIVNQVYDLICKIRDSGVTILLVEQNARKALGICDKAYVIENGIITANGTGSELLNSPVIKKAYLGG